MRLVSIRSKIPGECGYLALGLKSVVSYLNPSVSKARENGMLVDIVREALSQPENHGDPGEFLYIFEGEIDVSTLLFSSFSPLASYALTFFLFFTRTEKKKTMISFKSVASHERSNRVLVLALVLLFSQHIEIKWISKNYCYCHRVYGENNKGAGSD
jgi:hypothetical protein